jgi:hypothetical protein
MVAALGRDGRPELAFVDQSALEKLRLRAERGPAGEIGVLSDLDDTILPPAPSARGCPRRPTPASPSS